MARENDTAEQATAEDTSDFEAMLANWRRGLLIAERTTARCIAAADQIAEWIETMLATTVALPKTDPADCYEFDWPDGGIESSTIDEALRAAMAGLYAKAGAYRRHADKLHHAILDASKPDLVAAAEQSVNLAAEPAAINEPDIDLARFGAKFGEIRGMARAAGLVLDDLQTEAALAEHQAAGAP